VTDDIPEYHDDHPRDQPLRGRPHPHDRLHPRLYLAEFAGTALLVVVGLSVVILLFGEGSPLPRLLPGAGVRRAIAGFLFGSTGCAIALSPLGRVSGAHINPSVTLAFWLEGKLTWRDALGYVAAQLLGGAAGALPLLAWGATGRSVAYGATVPEVGLPAGWAVLGEAGCTFLLVTLIFVMAAHRRTQPLTPFTMPPLFCLLVWLEAPLSGTSTNLARSLGPALLAGVLPQQWVYVLGPGLGAVIAVALLQLEMFARHHPLEARLFHFRPSL
jgi:aquaporin Z